MWPLLVWMLSVLSVVAPCTAQGLTPSVFWKNPNITSSKDERIAIASAALEKADSRLQSNGQFNDSGHDTFARLYGQMAEFDRLTNQTRYKQSLKQCFALEVAVSPLFMSSLQNYELNYGYAAARAYAAYQDLYFLDLAVTAWTTAKQATISKEQAASGSVDGKQFNLSLSCQGATLAGGTYLSTSFNDPKLSGMESGLFLVLSGLLAEATSNQTYLDSAIESANFIQSHLLDPSSIVLDSVSSKSNESCSMDSTVFLYNSGIFIEGLAILAFITRNTSIEDLYVLAAYRTNSYPEKYFC
ncbi:hypothetical protein EDD18DRAFT_1294026 [Armillaria luteobubalina]|uniref:Uncharacterized protein n=1 Tax=Armillaria luteobubalina TaxID=153913 RepID=A0AA39PFM5_9AGAR|nr:hypothetical protein EDD18DRAFT_1294026 [Armillaria luteobubalina]